MQRETEKPERAPVFVVAASAVASCVVWLAVVKGVGYSVLAGFIYGIGYFVAMVLFFEVCGYSLFRNDNE
ncbi:MAG: hypothetical protein NTX71_05880 [Candidatus Aureabacteria bacterium]|nr:hypothetical protein [Candidatus Auribacterota bacterium]